MSRLVFTFLLVIIFGSLTISFSWAEGFDVRGYEQGMTKIEVENLAKSENQTIKIAELGWTIFTDPKRPMWINFCRDKLYRVSWIFDGGGLMQFLRIINDYIQNQGYENFESRTSVRVGYDGQEHGTLSHYLRKSGEPYYVEINLYTTENYDITNGQIIYEEWGEHTDCK